jgi:hypothetical protein
MGLLIQLFSLFPDINLPFTQESWKDTLKCIVYAKVATILPTLYRSTPSVLRPSNGVHVFFKQQYLTKYRKNERKIVGGGCGDCGDWL